MTWILENLETILAIYGGVVAVSTAIVKATPTTKDNEILEKIVNFFNHFSTVYTKEDLAKLAKAAKSIKK